jgi:hypothetical protein
MKVIILYRVVPLLCNDSEKEHVTAGKHVKNNRAIARQPPITVVEELLGTVFSVGSSKRIYYSENPRPVEGSSVD